MARTKAKKRLNRAIRKRLCEIKKVFGKKNIDYRAVADCGGIWSFCK